MTLRDRVGESRARFVRDTAEHTMAVLHDDGLYRHLRFQKPGTYTYYFDLITWPGYLAVTGDCGSFLFSRLRDMFEFFAPSGARGGFEDLRWGINPQYWSEKLQAPMPDGAMRFSPEAFEARVAEWFEDVTDEWVPEHAAALQAALDERVLVHPSSEHEAQSLLVEFEHDGRRIYDSWEWSLREYDWSFLWCCWGIVWGIERYHLRCHAEQREREKGGESA